MHITSCDSECDSCCWTSKDKHYSVDDSRGGKVCVNIHMLKETLISTFVMSIFMPCSDDLHVYILCLESFKLTYIARSFNYC